MDSDNRKNKISETEDMEKRFRLLYQKFVINNSDKIQRYLVNTLGLKAIEGRKPLNTSKPREFVTLREYEGNMEYCIKISYGSYTVKSVPTGCTEYERNGIVKSLKDTYWALKEDDFIGDFWNLIASNTTLRNKEFVNSDSSKEKNDKTPKIIPFPEFQKAVTRKTA